MKEQLKGSLALLGATVIWGFAFIAQSVGMDLIGPFTFQMVRCLLAVLFLIPCSFVLDLGKCSMKESAKKWKNPKLWKAGILCGCALFVASSLQQIGLVYTDAGKAGFITAMYIVLVPVLGLFFGRKVKKSTVFSVLMAVTGLYLLSCLGVTEVNVGDLFLMGCALAFAVQITCIDRLAADLDGFHLNCIQALTVAVISIPFVGFTEAVDMGNLLACWGPLCFAGCLSMGLAYSLQIVGQKALEPTTASLIMSLESVFAVLGGWWLLGERMAVHELLGCGLVFAAVVISQLPEKITVQRSHEVMAISRIKAIFPHDIQTVWNTVTSLEKDTWRSDLSRIETIDSHRFIEYTKDGYPTTFTITCTEICKRWEFDMDNSNLSGHWTGIFTEVNGQTEIDFTEEVFPKKIFMKPFVKLFLKKQQAQYVSDLRRALEK